MDTPFNEIHLSNEYGPTSQNVSVKKMLNFVWDGFAKYDNERHTDADVHN